MSFESSITKEAKAKIAKKSKQKEEHKMSNTKKIVIKTILATLGVLLTIVGLVYSGWALNDMYRNGIDKQVETKVQAMTAQVQVTESKQ